MKELPETFQEFCCSMSTENLSPEQRLIVAVMKLADANIGIMNAVHLCAELETQYGTAEKAVAAIERGEVHLNVTTLQ